MKKTLYALALLASFCFLNSCGKTDNDPNTTACYWHIGLNAIDGFNGARATRIVTINGLRSEGENNNSCTIYFSSFPTSTPGLGSTYKIVNYSKRTSLAANEIAIEITKGTGDTWLSTGYDNVTANVSIDNDKLTVSAVTPFTGRHWTSTPQADSAQLDAYLVE